MLWLLLLFSKYCDYDHHLIVAATISIVIVDFIIIIIIIIILIIHAHSILCNCIIIVRISVIGIVIVKCMWTNVVSNGTCTATAFQLLAQHGDAAYILLWLTESLWCTLKLLFCSSMLPLSLGDAMHTSLSVLMIFLSQHVQTVYAVIVVVIDVANVLLMISHFIIVIGIMSSYTSYYHSGAISII